MIVTGIEEFDKSRRKIWIDGEFAFVLYKSELRPYHIALGEELAAEDYERICREVLPKRAKLRAMNLLMKRDYTTAQLEEKLMKGGYAPEAAREAVAYVDSFHYTDDLRYAMDFIECHHGDRSRLRICQDLQRKGISRETLEKAWKTWEEQGGVQDEEGMIRELLRKREFDPETSGREGRQKEYAYLMRKGFPSEIVQRALFREQDYWD